MCTAGAMAGSGGAQAVVAPPALPDPPGGAARPMGAHPEDAPAAQHKSLGLPAAAEEGPADGHLPAEPLGCREHGRRAPQVARAASVQPRVRQLLPGSGQ